MLIFKIVKHSELNSFGKYISLLLVLIIGTSFSTRQSIDWTYPNTVKEIDKLIESSKKKPVLFFKHSNKCGLSEMIFDDFKKEWKLSRDEVKMVFIEVNTKRSLANYIESVSGYRHHSPQVIIYKDEKVVYQKTHGKIKVKDIEAVVK